MMGYYMTDRVDKVTEATEPGDEEAIVSEYFVQHAAY
jgi:hypothetical protein